jgi:hypothetical protein
MCSTCSLRTVKTLLARVRRRSSLWGCSRVSVA